MSAKTGSNGIAIGQENVQKYLNWHSQVEDFNPYVRHGTLNVARIAREAGLKRDVFYTNPKIRNVLWPSLVRRLVQEGVLQEKGKNPAEVIFSNSKRSGMDEALIKQMQGEIEALNTKVLELRKRLERYQALDMVLHTTGRLPW
ncbi:hypothetical protein AEP_01595 [Curvibacter sp. AEP1-3]|uniref:DUF6262 family protein n=1 Tax=Curvibacter sp. AEP1-3 TaxID=1844971 RepID=UPI000B3D06E0|nr:DUF6262 family protein [Curvibacter sp. AEP1-3]ARV18539.1 hypothetical protein AEP_01595 [Curvibacter sp. AEP1-3]